MPDPGRLPRRAAHQRRARRQSAPGHLRDLPERPAPPHAAAAQDHPHRARQPARRHPGHRAEPRQRAAHPVRRPPRPATSAPSPGTRPKSSRRSSPNAPASSSASSGTPNTWSSPAATSASSAPSSRPPAKAATPPGPPAPARPPATRWPDLRPSRPAAPVHPVRPRSDASPDGGRPCHMSPYGTEHKLTCFFSYLTRLARVQALPLHTRWTGAGASGKTEAMPQLATLPLPEGIVSARIVDWPAGLDQHSSHAGEPGRPHAAAAARLPGTRVLVASGDAAAGRRSG